jgi:hydroxypyruvate isomerase
MPRFAANVSLMFTEWDLLDRFAAAADAGFDAVEFQFAGDKSPERLSARISACGLPVSVFNAPPGRWDDRNRGLAAIDGADAEFAESILTAIRYAEAIGSPRFHVLAGVADLADPSTARRYHERLKLAADLAADRDLAIVIEPISRRAMPGYALDSFDLAKRALAAVGRPNLRLLFDTFHCALMDLPVPRTLHDVWPLTGHVQVATAPDRHEPSAAPVDHPGLFRWLDAAGYAGFVGCEYVPAAGTLAGLGWLEAWHDRRSSGDHE